MLIESTSALSRWLKLLEFVEIYIGLGGEPIALHTPVVGEPPDVVSFLRHYARDMKFKNGERVSYFAIRVSIGGAGSIWGMLFKS